MVADSLTEGGLVKCGVFSAAAALGGYLPVFDDVFGLVRGRTFDIGVGIARATKRGDHPLVQPAVGPDGKVTYVIRADVMKAEPVARDARIEAGTGELVKLGAHVRRALGAGVFGLFGGVDFRGAEAFRREGAVPSGCH